MSSPALCAICHKRRPKRHCPGVRGEICAICCGTEREVSVDCPYECPYLRESRRYGAKAQVPPEEKPFSDVEVPESFLAEQDLLLGQIGYQILRCSLEDRSIVDNTVLEALDKLIRTYQTQLAGIYYESLPENPAATAVFRGIKKFLDELEQKQHRSGEFAPPKDSELIRAFVFFYRLAMVQRNGRPLGRAFLDSLRTGYPQGEAARPESTLIVPGR